MEPERSTLNVRGDTMRNHNSRRDGRRRLAIGIRPVLGILATAILMAACDSSPTEPPRLASVAGLVTSTATGQPVAGAQVSIGSITDITGADGRFELKDVQPGRWKISCTAPGFVRVVVDITVPDGGVDTKLELTPRKEVFESGDFAIYVPRLGRRVVAVILALGGPDTRAFATKGSFGAPVPEVEAALQALGQDLRTLADTSGLAIIGTSVAAMANSPESDQFLLAAMDSLAKASGQPDLLYASILMYGISGGAPEASGFTARNPTRVAGLFLKVPAAVSALTSGKALQVPTMVVMAERDTFVNNAATTAAYEANRKIGALWALALEPAVPHHSLSPAQRKITLSWMRDVFALRLMYDWGPGLYPVDETAGWLGNNASGAAYSWKSYPGDRTAASWLPSDTVAKDWVALVKGGTS
jgi:dienelactone hydrolase